MGFNIHDYPPRPASSYIDLDKINRACDSIIEAARSIEKSVDNLEQAETTCTKDALYNSSKNPSTMDKPIATTKDALNGSKSGIGASASAIKAQIMEYYRELQRRYEAWLEEQARLERERERQARANASNNNGGGDK